ncbi:GRB10-interacting GYF protein 1-like isoform X1 [Scleropages formosus]|uniref:GRB10 interacting GYF protein 1 n=1 Tax=Scleropages formosus TaxID=113540 RepID=A0A8C9T8V0_SCLFO|nr:GRB10-interacting GYF protein 1-like isoform X1 [Scleropages formosus]XP_029107358.1 GRB10-interacting GYF protein 1-like isoform X1 [Scleropages formosus]
MTAETLNFGPEWLRALSGGGSVTSPPPSPAMPKYKLAEYRYGREEMLALYIKDNKVPEDMQDKEFAAILQEEPLQPLALVPLTEEEQRNFSMSVNSVAVLRLMGKAGGPIPTAMARGRGSTRGGRGRGRGESAFYQRNAEEGEVGFSRSTREIHRSQSWDDRGERRFEKPLRRDGIRVGFEEVGPTSRKEYTRSDSENWRTLREEQMEDEGSEPGGSWRMAGSRREDGGPRSAGWREHGEGRRRKFDFDFREHPEGGRRRACSEGLEEERDGLPEWCTDEEDGEMGTFDSSGAFLPIKKGSKDPIPEEQELEFQGLEEEEERNSESERKNSDEKAEAKETAAVSGDERKSVTPPSPRITSAPEQASSEPQTKSIPNSQPMNSSRVPGEVTAPASHISQLSPGTSSSLSSSPPSSSSAAIELPLLGGDTEDDEGMKHLQQEAEKMVASLQDSTLEEENNFTNSLHETCNTAAALPLSHEAAMKWFYKDPQGEIQGPFTTLEMSEWFQAGYFSMTLLVKRGCDEGFQPLGDVIKMWGRVPFAPGPSPPPLLGNMDQDRLKKQQELAAAALYQQLQQQQLFQLINRCGDQGMNRSMSVPDTGSMWDMHTSASQQSGSEASLWDLTMNSSTQGPTLEQLQKLQQERREAELRAKHEEDERKRREEKKRREEEEIFRRKQQCRQQQELILKLLQQTQQQAMPSWGVAAATLSKQLQQETVPGWGIGMGATTLSKQLQQEAERQLQKQQQRDRHGSLSMGSSGMSGLGGQWNDSTRTSWVGPPDSGIGVWDEAMKNQAGLRNIALKNNHSSPPISEPYLLNRRKRTDEEDRLLKLLQGMKPQDGFTTWCEQMLHTLNTSNNSSSSLDVATIVAYLKEVDSPYEVHDFIRSYLGDTVEAKEFAKQFLERRAKQKASLQRQQQQLSKEVAGMALNIPLQDSMRGIHSSTLQSVFQSTHMGKMGLPDCQGAKMRKKQPMMLHSDPSILGYSFHSAREKLSLGKMEPLEEY